MSTPGQEEVRAFISSMGLPAKARDKDYLNHVRAQPCIYCAAPCGCAAHHYPLKGMGGGGDWSDYFTVPACALKCHIWWHEKATREEREAWKEKMWKWMLESLQSYWSATPTADCPMTTIF